MSKGEIRAKKKKLYMMKLEEASNEVYEKYDNIMLFGKAIFIYSAKKVPEAFLIDPKDIRLPQKVRDWAIACELVSAKLDSQKPKNKKAIKQLENDFTAELDKALDETVNKCADINEFSTLKNKGFTIERG